MERAKAIKENRELARELGTHFSMLGACQCELETCLASLDDVLQYERKAGASGNRRRQSTKAKRAVGELDTEEEAQKKESSESEESNSPVAKRKKVRNYTLSGISNLWKRFCRTQLREVLWRI
jgi:uncharacterized membrane protein YccC